MNDSRAGYRVGVDVGGTFTDFVLIDEGSGRSFLGKRLTTPQDPAIGVIDGLGSVLEEAGVAAPDINIAIHGTTLITNALIERTGAKTAFLTTEGFRDVPEMGTEVRYDIYDLFLKKPEPLVPRNLRYEIRERLDNHGNVISELDEEGLRRLAGRIRKEEIDAIAVTFLHSFRNPSHEQRAMEILAGELPGVSISLSSAVAPEIREYERMSTTIANAYVQPLTRDYIDQLENGLAELGFRHRLYFMISSGGIATGQTAREFPIRMVESGPTAGVLAALFYGSHLGIDSAVTFDMGGTTAKIGLIKNGRAAKSNMIEVARVDRFKKGSGIPVKVPIVELIEIGAGGGSIAHVDQLGLLKVGPRSAGADPGPACYGLDGVEPTVTDGNVVLGYLDPDYFLGGSMPLNREAAGNAIRGRLAEPLSLSLTDAARGIFEVVNQNMLAAMKVHIAERGEDPRKFYLFAFGGAGPAHAYELARSLQMKGVVVPPGAGTTSAMGLVTTEVAFDYARSLVTRLDSISWDEIRGVFRTMDESGFTVLKEAGIDPDGSEVKVSHAMDMRHKGQGHEVTVPIPSRLIEAGSVDAAAELFYAAHEEKYGHAHRNLPVELITCRTTVSAPPPSVALQPVSTPPAYASAARKGSRRIYFPEISDYAETPVYDRYRLAPNTHFDGPAAIEERECTVVAGPSSTLRVDEFGSLFIDLLQKERNP